MTSRIVLNGLSGTGKSTLGARLAAELGWSLADTDAMIEQREGRSVPEIFATSGEAAFREIERAVLTDALQADRTVVATGGGAVAHEEVWGDTQLGDPDCLTIWLDAPPEELIARLERQQESRGEHTVRPLLAGDNPLERFRAMRRERESFYRRSDITLPVTGRTVDELASTIAGVARAEPSWQVDLEVPGGISRIQIGHGMRTQLPEVIRERWPRARTIWILSDEQVAAHHLESTRALLEERGLTVRSFVFPPGEGSKSVASLARVYDAMLEGGIERSDCVVALGGGVTGDLAGFAAATVLRGVGLVQMPTNVLSMVDSSVGGKTGINHATGKNLIGAFYQPAEVLVDPVFLETLPDRQYRNGWAEIIKHGLIEPSTPAGDSGLLALIEANADALANRRSPLLAAIIARNVEIKSSVVRADEREAGLRAILNFGHTVGHAVEASGYRLLHGEAVAVGLHAVMRLGVALGRTAPEAANAVETLLVRFGLPVRVAAELNSVRRYMSHDKKRLSGEQQWVLPRPEGGVEVVRGVPSDAVESALRQVISEAAG